MKVTMNSESEKTWWLRQYKTKSNRYANQIFKQILRFTHTYINVLNISLMTLSISDDAKLSFDVWNLIQNKNIFTSETETWITQKQTNEHKTPKMTSMSLKALDHLYKLLETTHVQMLRPHVSELTLRRFVTCSNFVLLHQLRNAEET